VEGHIGDFILFGGRKLGRSHETYAQLLVKEESGFGWVGEMGLDGGVNLSWCATFHKGFTYHDMTDNFDGCKTNIVFTYPQPLQLFWALSPNQ
jgi:hypothetical protein